MSLINKMLQDLDARGPQAGALPQDAVRPVALRERAAAPRALLIGAALALGAAAALGWRAWQRPLPQPVAPAVSAASAPAAAPLPKPVAPVPVPMPVALVSAAPTPQRASRSGAAGRIAGGTMPKPARGTGAARPPGSNAGLEESERLAGKRAAAKVEPFVAQGKLIGSARQQAEGEYRRALLSLQEGRVAEALGGLAEALDLDPRHQAARETLIRLLLENQRQNDAIRQLRLGLGVDPAQPAMAMLLARLQLEQGGPAVDTLMRTLPFAAANGEYRAFLAAVLQRGQRHKEAAEQYEQALRGAPQNGVWWMGLGISLQAEQRLGEAKEAFMHAKTSPNLAPDLQAFVERKLQLLAH